MSENFEFASKRPITYKVPTIDDIVELQWNIQHVNAETGKPWRTKSDADLEVLFHFPLNLVKKITCSEYHQEEIGNLPGNFDIRGLRSYSVRDIPENKIGGLEFHRIRHEIICALDGETQWRFEDVYGNTRDFALSGNKVLYFPPFLKHDYKTPENKGGSLLVLCNTLFNPQDKRTHDTYSAEVFNKLQEEFAKN